MSDNGFRESRKLVKWGSSNTLIVSLPRRWVKQNNLTEKDEIEIRETCDGTLLVSPRYEEEGEQPPAQVDANELKSLEAISQAMLVKYLDGENTIEVTNKRNFKPAELTVITNTCYNLLGFEISRKTPSVIELKDIMSFKEANIFLLVKILTRQTVELFSTILDALKFKNRDLINTIDQSQKNTERYYYRIMRQLRKALLQPTSLVEMNCNNQDIVDMAFYITYVNDTSLSISSSARAVRKFTPALGNPKVLQFMTDVKDFFTNATRCYLFQNVSQAIKLLSKSETLTKQKRSIEDEIDMLAGKQNIAEVQIALDNVEKIVEYSHRIALTALRRSL